jgi:heterotetrameric sarcosine oxidase alpha subunit
MNGQPFRNAKGGLIDRDRPLGFTFNGRRHQGFAGDTLASALLASGVRRVARSFKYHRPRGIFAAGEEEPNALVQLRIGTRTEPNIRATRVELFDGLVAASQNCWPSVDFDLGAGAAWVSRLMPPGFYYKTFKWPNLLWPAYEHVLRKLAGMGVAPRQADPDRYEHRFAHCDVLVVGGGPAGLAAAIAAGRAGARVIVADDGPEFGGSLAAEARPIDGAPAQEWAAAAVAELTAMPDVTLVRRASVFGYYDHNALAIAEHVADHLAEPLPFQPRQRLWMVRARQVVLATGATERSFVFADNDRPGIMLASAARAYANRFAVRAGRRCVVFTNNDSAYGAAADLAAAGIEISAVIDARPGDPGPAAAKALGTGIERLAGHAIVATRGSGALTAVEVAPLNKSGDGLGGSLRRFDCDLLCVSGGWNPAVQLHAQAQGRPVYDDTLAAFVPGPSVQAERSAGSAKGTFTLAGCLADGMEAGAEAARQAGFEAAETPPVPACEDEGEAAPMRALWSVPPLPGQRRKCFVDLQTDVTQADVELASREGYKSVEHVKRYTTLGMGTDQGRTGNVAGLAILARQLGTDIPQVGTTTFRPPYVPVTMGTLAGRETGHHFQPVRRSAMHGWHKAAGAAFVTAGLWLRPQYYVRPGESMWDAIYRETMAVRKSVGMVDVSTLGKIDIQGADAAEFLNRVYINAWSKLGIGRCRYGVMLREDGIAFDDGTTSRLGETHYLMTTTTASAGPVMQHLEYFAQVVWPALDVHIVSVTEEWAAIALAGPDSRKVLERLTDDVDVSNEALPFMGVRQGTFAGVAGRLFRISFSGELAYEINVPADYGPHLWEAMLAAGKDFDITPYGTEALGILRTEKGHVVGGELNGRTTADDLGFGRMASSAKEFIGKRSLNRPGLTDENRKQLIGLVPADGKTAIPRGAQIVSDPDQALSNPMIGEVTSACYSPNLEMPIGLGIVAAGRARMGETLYALSPMRGERVAVTVTNPVFIDPEGERLRA